MVAGLLTLVAGPTEHGPQACRFAPALPPEGAQSGFGRPGAGLMRFDVITLFPELFAPHQTCGVTRRAYDSGAIGLMGDDVAAIVEVIRASGD